MTRAAEIYFQMLRGGGGVPDQHNSTPIPPNCSPLMPLRDDMLGGLGKHSKSIGDFDRPGGNMPNTYQMLESELNPEITVRIIVKGNLLFIMFRNLEALPSFKRSKRSKTVKIVEDATRDRVHRNSKLLTLGGSRCQLPR